MSISTRPASSYAFDQLRQRTDAWAYEALLIACELPHEERRIECLFINLAADAAIEVTREWEASNNS